MKGINDKAVANYKLLLNSQQMTVTATSISSSYSYQVQFKLIIIGEASALASSSTYQTALAWSYVVSVFHCDSRPQTSD